MFLLLAAGEGAGWRTPAISYSLLRRVLTNAHFSQCPSRRFQLLCLYHLSAPIRKHLGDFKSWSTILSCRDCLGKLFGDSKHYTRKTVNISHPGGNGNFGSREWINKYKYDQMTKSRSVERRGINTDLTSARLLELKLRIPTDPERRRGRRVGPEEV